MTPSHQPLFARVRELARKAPVVVAHRGNSRFHPENTVAAFRSAVALGAPMQEFDVQVTADGRLLCLHDPTLDRTTNATAALGPGALIAQLRCEQIEALDAGSWKGRHHAGARVPTLADAIAVMLPRSIPMIEHKAGPAAAFATELRRLGAGEHALVQSFDWAFLAEFAGLAPEVPLGLLGPTATNQRLDADVIAAARALRAGLIHWHAPEVTSEAVTLVHDSGLLLCTYTSDDELSWQGGRAMGVDAMCTNDPAAMLLSQDRAQPTKT